jgi:hypothetical protein
MTYPVVVDACATAASVVLAKLTAARSSAAVSVEARSAACAGGAVADVSPTDPVRDTIVARPRIIIGSSTSGPAAT